jgi:ubiquinone/menaquinone biosynthesis C-methylase UbiE
MTTEQARPWQSAEAAEIWRHGAAWRAQFLTPATEAMLDAANVTTGMRVLDVAAGSGDQSLLAARRVGPTGSVLATDISASMLGVAADVAREAGLTNIETKVSDAAALDVGDGEFDAAICRFGLMFVSDLQQALNRIRDALKPNARFAALVWSSEERNPRLGLQIAIVREMGRLPSPPPSIVRTVLLAGPGKLEGALREAGFRDVHVSPVATRMEFASAEAAVEAIRTSSPVQGELTRDMSAEESARYFAELERRLAAYVQSDGRCLLPGEALLGVGTK